MEIARNAQLQEEEDRARKVAKKENIKERFALEMNNQCSQYDLGGVSGTEKLYEQMLARKERGEATNITKCNRDVSNEEDNCQFQGNGKRRRANLLGVNSGAMIGIGQVLENDRIGNQPEMIERQKADQRKRQMLAAPPRAKRINISNTIKPTPAKAATNQTNVTLTNDEITEGSNQGPQDRGVGGQSGNSHAQRNRPILWTGGNQGRNPEQVEG